MSYSLRSPPLVMEVETHATKQTYVICICVNEVIILFEFSSTYNLCNSFIG